MHALLSRLDIIILLNPNEILTDFQFREIKRTLRLNKQLYNTDNSILIDQIKTIYIRRYPRLDFQFLFDLESYYDHTIKQYLKQIFAKIRLSSPYAPPPKSYQNILECHRLQEQYILQEPKHKRYAQAHLLDLLDADFDENYKCIVFAQTRKFDDNRIILMSDLLRRRMSQLHREISDRNQFIDSTIKCYWNRRVNNRLPIKSPSKLRLFESPLHNVNQNLYFIKPSALRRTATPKRDNSIRITTENVYERKSHSRSIYQVKRIQLLEEEGTPQGNRVSSSQALRPRNSRGVIRTKLQQLNCTMKYEAYEFHQK